MGAHHFDVEKFGCDWAYTMDGGDIGDLEYENFNAATIDTIRFYLTNSAHIDSITVYAWASPEGGYPHNKWLSEKRAAAAKELLLELAPDSTKLNEGKIKISPLAENWPGLTELVEKNYHRQDRDRLLRILRTEGIGEETRKWRIKQLDNGYTWEYLKRKARAQFVRDSLLEDKMDSICNGMHAIFPDIDPAKLRGLRLLLIRGR